MKHALQVGAFKGPILSTSSLLIDYLRLDLAAERTEQLRVLYLDINNNLLGDVLLAHGSVSEVRVYPREIVRQALEFGATAIILVHNHPSGDPTPSQEDVRVTQRVAAAAAIFDLHLHDHLIVARGGWTSLAAMGVIKPLQVSA